MPLAISAMGSKFYVKDNVETGDRERAGRLQQELAPLDREIVGKLGPAGVKAAMDAVGGGLYGGPVRPPLAPVAPADRERLAKLVAA